MSWDDCVAKDWDDCIFTDTEDCVWDKHSVTHHDAQTKTIVPKKKGRSTKHLLYKKPYRHSSPLRTLQEMKYRNASPLPYNDSLSAFLGIREILGSTGEGGIPIEDWRPRPGEDWRLPPIDYAKRPYTARVEDWRPRPGEDWRPRPGEDWRPRPGEDWRPRPGEERLAPGGEDYVKFMERDSDKVIEDRLKAGIDLPEPEKTWQWVRYFDDTQWTKSTDPAHLKAIWFDNRWILTTEDANTTMVLFVKDTWYRDFRPKKIRIKYDRGSFTDPKITFWYILYPETGFNLCNESGIYSKQEVILDFKGATDINNLKIGTSTGTGSGEFAITDIEFLELKEVKEGE